MLGPTSSPIPNLRTLDLQSSWLNRAGRVDRSACLALRASDLWRLLPSNAFQGYPSKSKRSPAIMDGQAEMTMTRSFVERIWNKRFPISLNGDRRTQKSNAMRWRQPYLEIDPRATTILPHPMNPNAGACRVKSVGLSNPDIPHASPWSQTLAIVRFRYPCMQSDATSSHKHSNVENMRTQHFLRCPTCRETSTWKYNHRKHTMLYLPLCLYEEFDDAAIVQRWLHRSRAHRMNQPWNEAELQLIDRYAILFPPRQFRCRSCLGIRYGEVKRT